MGFRRGTKMAGILTFDCYGTLLDTAPIYGEIEHIAQTHGLDGKNGQGHVLQL